MVQILKPQMRNYQADQTEAIRQQQITQNISEVSNLVTGIANVYNAFQKDAEAKQKQAEQADQDIINTEIGEQANIQASVAAGKALGSLDPTSEAGMSAINEAYAKAYAPYEEQIGTERGKIALQTKQRQGADAYIKSASKAYSSNEAVKARQAAANLQNAMSFKAEELGAVGDLDSFNEAVAKNVDIIGNYAEAQGIDKQEAVYSQKEKYAKDWIGGYVISQPLEAAKLIGVDEGARDTIIKQVRQQNPELSVREAASVVDKMYEAKKGWSKEQLNKIYGGVDTIDWIRESRTEELKKRQEQYSSKSPIYREIESKIKALEGDGIYDVLREEMREDYAPYINQVTQQHILAEDKRKYDTVVSLAQDTMDSDPVIASNARRELKQMLKTKEGKQQFSRIVDGEISADELVNKINTAAQNIEDVKMQKYPTFSGGDSIHKAVKEFVNDNVSTPAQLVVKAQETLETIHKAEITEEQEEEAKTLVYQALRDKFAGDLLGKVFNNSDKYFPDLNYIDRYLPIVGTSKPEDVYNEGREKQERSSLAATKAFVETGLLRIYDNSVKQANQIMQMEPEKREQAMRNLEAYIIQEKRALFDSVMSEYGIDLPPLREKIKLGQPVYVQVGSKIQQYMGDDSNGMPIFKDYVDPAQQKMKETALNWYNGIRDALKDKKGE